MTQKRTDFLRLLAFQLVVFMTLCAAPLTAQEQSGFILGTGSEVIFPAAIRFEVSAALTLTELQDAQLTISQGNRLNETIRVNLTESAVKKEPFSVLSVIWRIPSDTPPLLFENITYEWALVASNGEIATASNTLEFTDQRVTWTRDDDPSDEINLTLPTGKFDAAALRNEVTPLYERAAGRYSWPLLNVILYDAAIPPGCVIDEQGKLAATAPVTGETVECIDPAIEQAIFDASGYTLVVSQTTSSAGAVEALVITLIDEFYADSWAAKQVPDWFRVGFQEFATPTRKADLLPPMLAAARADTEFSLGDMQTVLSEENPDVELWRMQAYSMVLYVASRIGVPAVFDLAANIGEADSFDAAYQTAVGESPAALLPAWKRWLFLDSTTAAYSLNPYETKPTPTPTVTPTPTMTFTLSPIPSATPTFTPTDNSTSTPRPTWTRTPLPPSVTPRPPGSLHTRTPTPTPLPPPIFDTGSDVALVQTLVIAGAVILLAVLIVAYIRLGKPR